MSRECKASVLRIPPQNCCSCKQKTAYEMRISDWSSDVCSSDLPALPPGKSMFMPASSPSIAIANLGWSTPDGRAVLSSLDLHFQCERTGLVGRNGVGKSTLLRLLDRKSVVQGKSVSERVALGGRRILQNTQN